MENKMQMSDNKIEMNNPFKTNEYDFFKKIIDETEDEELQQKLSDLYNECIVISAQEHLLELCNYMEMYNTLEKAVWTKMTEGARPVVNELLKILYGRYSGLSMDKIDAMFAGEMIHDKGFRKVVDNKNFIQLLEGSFWLENDVMHRRNETGLGIRQIVELAIAQLKCVIMLFPQILKKVDAYSLNHNNKKEYASKRIIKENYSSVDDNRKERDVKLKGDIELLPLVDDSGRRIVSVKVETDCANTKFKYSWFIVSGNNKSKLNYHGASFRVKSDYCGKKLVCEVSAVGYAGIISNEKNPLEISKSIFLRSKEDTSHNEPDNKEKEKIVELNNDELLDNTTVEMDNLVLNDNDIDMDKPGEPIHEKSEESRKTILSDSTDFKNMPFWLQNLILIKDDSSKNYKIKKERDFLDDYFYGQHPFVQWIDDNEMEALGIVFVRDDIIDKFNLCIYYDERTRCERMVLNQIDEKNIDFGFESDNIDIYGCFKELKKFIPDMEERILKIKYGIKMEIVAFRERIPYTKSSKKLDLFAKPIDDVKELVKNEKENLKQKGFYTVGEVYKNLSKSDFDSVMMGNQGLFGNYYGSKDYNEYKYDYDDYYGDSYNDNNKGDESLYDKVFSELIEMGV